MVTLEVIEGVTAAVSNTKSGAVTNVVTAASTALLRAVMYLAGTNEIAIAVPNVVADLWNNVVTA